jgi:D-alanyl-D-alanine carboxypeptidase
MQRRCPHLICLALMLASSIVGYATAEDYSVISRHLDENREKLRVPGALIGIYRGDKPDFVAALGKSNVEHDVPMTADCSFRIASISKVFVGHTVLTLVRDGKVSLDEPIAKYVDGVPHGDRITLRHLGSHRSGLFNHIESREVKNQFAADPAKAWTMDDLLGFCLAGPTYFEPGEKHHYSNGNTVLLAMVIEKATGHPWEDEVRSRVLDPLGLAHTIIPTDNTLPDPHAEGYALGQETGPFFHRGLKRFNVTGTSPTWWGPAGSMISTLDDLHKAAKPLATGSLLDDKTRAELHNWTAADQDGYQYGFHIERVKGGIGHDGDVPGYQSCMYYLPEHDATIVGLTNIYGWSLPGMPANQLTWQAARELGLVAE